MIDLKTASYKGVEFLFIDSETTGGNKNIGFTFPGSDFFSVQTQGKIPLKFVLNAVIPHDNYYEQINNLIRVLSDKKKGTLVHPTFGAIENVKAGVFKLNERISELGRADIEMNFDIDNAPGIPTQSANLASQVAAESIAMNAQAAADMADSYEVSTTFVGNVGDAIQNAAGAGEALLGALEAGTAAIGAVADDIASYQAQVNGYINRVGDLVRAPANLATSISSLFESLNSLTGVNSQVLSSMRSLFNFGADDPVLFLTTAGRIERDRNRAAMRAMMRTQALSYAYQNASQVEYNTVDDLDSIQNELEAVYLDLRNNQSLTNEALEQLDRLRVQFGKTLEGIALNTRSIITIETTRKPLSVLLYEYYGSTELFDVISDLNNVKQNAFVEGELRILTP